MKELEIKSIISFDIFIYKGNNDAKTALLAYEDIAEDIITNSKVIYLLHILSLPNVRHNIIYMFLSQNLWILPIYEYSGRS